VQWPFPSDETKTVATDLTETKTVATILFFYRDDNASRRTIVECGAAALAGGRAAGRGHPVIGPRDIRW